MAFSLDVHLDAFEYRAMRTGNGQNGPWLSLILENPTDARQIDVSVPKDMQNDVYAYHLAKGDHVSCDVVAYAGTDYSRIRLVKITSIIDADGVEQV